MKVKLKVGGKIMDDEGYCGIDCKTCRLFQATINDDLQQKNMIASDWKILFNWNLTIADMRCEGCKSEVVFGNCATCDIKNCAQVKGYERCQDCTSYPCDKIHRLKKNIAISNPTVTF